MRTGIRQVAAFLAKRAGRLDRRSRALGSAIVGLALLALVAVVLVPGAGSTRGVPKAGERGGAGVVSEGTGAAGPLSTGGAPDPSQSAVIGTTTPDPAAAAASASAGGQPGAAAPGTGTGGGTHAGPGSPQPAPRYPKPRPEVNRTAPPRTAPAPVGPGSVWPGDFPDPSVLRVGTTYYAYSTETAAQRVPVIRSLDLVHWQGAGDALPALPAWSGGLDVWAPAVVRGASDYVLFYTTRDNRTGDQCISRAVSLLPQGPFVDSSAGPFVCQLQLGGSIDPDPFVDANGAQWLLWKSQGTLTGVPPRLWAQPVTGDWGFLAGTPTPILSADRTWEAGVVEAPSLVRQGGRYLLLYSGNNWDSAGYGIGYAVCTAVTGPCVKPSAGPVMSTHGAEAGPGSPGLFFDLLGHLRVAYHAWTLPLVGYPAGARSLHIATATMAGNQLAINE